MAKKSSVQVAVQQPPEVTNATQQRADELTLAEMTRVMDVATLLRKERIEVQKQFNLQETKAILRRKLLETAELTGEDLTAAEVDAAIEQYFENLHEYEDPPMSPRVLLAHLYVMRGWLFKAVAAVVLVIGSIVAWFGFASARESAELNRLWNEWQRHHDAVASLAEDDRARKRLASHVQDATDARAGGDIEELNQQVAETLALRRLLEAEYEMVIVSEPGQQSAVDRYYTDAAGERVSGYYVIVQARDANGGVVTKGVRNRETGKLETVTTWAEQVPKEVFDRLASDKQADGVLDEITFAKKSRGSLDAQVVMRDGAGRPLERTGQITTW